MANETRNRAQNGQYQTTFEKVCECGHTNGEHDAERTKHEGETFQYCQADGCECECFKKD